jgi:lipid-A-disaccharide synthase
MIVTGEASGDLHGAKLMSAITAQRPDTRFFGVGGKNKKQPGQATYLAMPRWLSLINLTK